MKTTADVFLSRNFVEFGPFTTDEMSGFASRGILLAGDFVKANGGDSWLPCNEWLASLNGSPPDATPTAAAEASPPKTPAKKRAATPKAKK
ncbi:MAG TPA: hypothetical protein VG796_21450 [Verrucomicrobiales bacterium]|jgi:hypothetical protein|nr:hypothetical protein [Verrucomicrobiales bacterium]